MRSYLKSFFPLLLVFLLANPAFSQQTDPMTAGILSFRSGNYSEAVSQFEKALSADPNNAEAHFLLARLFWETDLRDSKRAKKEIQDALLIEPNNVQYLVASLQQLREDAAFSLLIKRESVYVAIWQRR